MTPCCGRWRVAAALTALVALGAACRQILPTNRYLQPRASSSLRSTADARGKFDHALHAATFDSAGLACDDCHRFDLVIESSDEDLARDLSARGLYPGSAPCHYCHAPGDTKMAAAPGGCRTCHDNLLPLKPPDHDLAWSKVHAAMAEAEPTRCEGCHAQKECIDCHARRDTVQTVVHERNFLFFHSIEARANPMQCGSCHREDFCIRCHEQGKVEVGR
jgi:Cytochrome c7 and related cytochrome c